MSTPDNSRASTTTVANPALTQETDKRDIRSTLKRQFQQGLAFGTLVILFIFFSVFTNGFMTVSNMTTILLGTAVIAILALGTTFVIITGGIDLSIGTGMALCAVMTGVFVTNMGMPIWLGVIGGVLTGMAMGLINGVNVAYLGLPPFIATLAMMMIAGGLALIVSGVSPIYFSRDSGFQAIAMGNLIPGVPNVALILVTLVVIGYIALNKSLLGRFTFAIGSNEEATRLSGVNTRRWKIRIYVLAGAFTGVAGVVIASRLGSAQPQIGMGYELQAIAAVIIGGTSLLGGRGSIVGTMIGALIMGVLINGLRIMSVQTEWQNVIVGFVVLVAVFFDTLRNRVRA